MTLVASVSPFGCPLMLGDILISGQPGSQTRVVLPTIGNLPLVEDSVVDLSQVAWLSQKISLITENLAVGWAGGHEPARRIISRMRAYPWNDQVTVNDVQQCLATTDYDDQAAVSLVGVFSHDRGFGEFGLNSTSVNLPLFNQSRVIGSGRRSFISLAHGLNGLDVRSNGEGSNNDSSWHKAILLTLASAGYLIGEEINTYGGLREGFGGMFELLAFDNGRFAKLDDILYCFWVVAGHNRAQLELAVGSTFIKAKYYGDSLVVRRADFADRQQMRNHQIIVGPMAKSVDMTDLQNIPELDMNAIHDCHYVAVRNGDAYEVLTMVNLFGNSSLVRFHRFGNGKVSFAVESKLLSYMHERVVEKFHAVPS